MYTQHNFGVLICKNKIWTIFAFSITLGTYDTFPTFSLETFFQPPPFEEFLEMNFQFSIVSILNRHGYDHR
jgi:hypothetical protein